MSSNGSTLRTLNAQTTEVRVRVMRLREDVALLERLAKPVKFDLETTENRLHNAERLLNVWWNEFKAAGGKA